MTTSLHTKAINMANLIVDNAEHDLLVVICLRRAKNRPGERFPFRFRNRMLEVWLSARIEEQNAMRSGANLVITNYKDGSIYFSTPLALAEQLKERLAG